VAAPRYATESFVSSLLDGDREALLSLGHDREWQRGDVLFHAGDRADSAIVVLAGLVKVHKVAPDGADVVLALLGPGDLLGEISAVRDAGRSASATALDSVRAVAIAVPELRAFLTKHHRSTLALLEMTLSRLYVADTRRLEFATAGSLARVSSRLVELAERFGQRRGEGVIEVAVPISQEDLAAWSAASRESTARALRTLRELGVVRTHRLRITVVDLDGLRSHAAWL
jgi:CRP/FNR family cyclic AMP-dependent transcriptional regulator